MIAPAGLDGDDAPAAAYEIVDLRPPKNTSPSCVSMADTDFNLAHGTVLDSFHFRHRLVRVGRVRDDALIGAIGQQVELLQDRLSDQYLVAENQRLLPACHGRGFQR